MKNPINIALLVIIALLLGFTIFKNMNKGTDNFSHVETGPMDANGYQVIDMEGTPVKKLVKLNESNNTIETGETLDGLKTGTWTTFYNDGRVKSISSYLAGKLSGVLVNFTDKGQVELQANYKDGLLNGDWATYNNGSRKKEERSYIMGKLNGINKHYSRSGKLQKEIGFKNDLQHGIFKYYDDDGNITLEYEYKDGEKVSGGIVKE